MKGSLTQYMAVADMVLDEGVFTDKPEVRKLSWDPAKQKYVHGIGVCYKDTDGKVLDDNPPPECGAARPNRCSDFRRRFL